MRRTLSLPRSACLAFSLAAWLVGAPTAQAGVTGNSYDVTAVAEVENLGTVALSGCASFENDGTLEIDLRAEGVVITQTISPYSEVDFLLFGIWSTGGGQEAVVSGIHLWFGTVVIAGPDLFFFNGNVGGCSPLSDGPSHEATSQPTLDAPLPAFRPSPFAGANVLFEAPSLETPRSPAALRSTPWRRLDADRWDEDLRRSR